jgi:hypothetical protein
VIVEGYVEAIGSEDKSEEVNFGMKKFQAEFAVESKASVDEDRCETHGSCFSFERNSEEILRLWRITQINSF